MSEQPGFLNGIIGRQITKRALEDDREKKAKGREIVSRSIGSIPAGPEPTREWGQMLGDIGLGDYSSPQAGPQGPEYGGDKEFSKRIVGESIRKNALTGGRHPNAAPLKTKEPKQRIVPLGDGDSVTPLNSNPVRPPRTAGEFGDFMKTLTADYGIKFPGEQERNGYQSIYLPGTRSAGEDESAADNKVMGRSPQQSIDLVNGGSTEIVIGGNMGAQSGTSDSADKGELKRVVKGVNGTEFGGEAEAPPTIFKDARTRAFLDYDGDKPMMAMRAAEAAQNTIKQNGVLYALDGEGKGTAIDETTAREFKKDGNKMASQDFLRNYRYEPEGTTDMPIADITEAEDTGTFTRGLESNVIEDPSEEFRALGLM